jgi:hypothetical protein
MTTRSELHRIAAHVLGRRRFDVSGHFGLRASPGGIATPAFGPEPEVLRIAGTVLVREIGAEASAIALNVTTLEELAHFAGVDLDADFSAGANTPPIGPRDEPVHLDPKELTRLTDWFDLGWQVLDACTAQLGDGWTWTTTQIWPEHFDAGTALTRGDGSTGINLGFSPGDDFSPDPYVYVGPWGEERPGDPAFWNAPFGAFATDAEAPDASAALTFLRTGLDLLEKDRHP